MKLTERLSATDLAELDTLIVERRVLPLLKFIRSRLGVSISETQVVWLERYRELRIERPEQKPRRPQYYTTERFLQLFSLESLDDLPQSQD